MKNKKLPTWVKFMPKKVIICGKRYSITYTNEDAAASGDIVICCIKVGCDCSKQYAVDSLIHEISELVHLENYHIYSKGCACGSGENNEKRLFVFNHDGFEHHIHDLVGALRDCGLLSKAAS